MSYESIIEAYQSYGRIPSKPEEWALADEDGDTVAHFICRRTVLTPTFKGWDLEDANGDTVAHHAARFGTLPKDFNQWSLKNRQGITVAHVAAMYGKLPRSAQTKTILKMKDDSGYTVAELKKIYESKQLSRMLDILRS